MKRLYAAIALVLFLVSVCFASVKVIDKKYDSLIILLEECENAFGSDMAEEKCNELEKHFSESESVLCIFVNRSVLDEIAISITRLPDSAKAKDRSAFFGECSTIRLSLSKMKSDESFSLLSFF